MSRPRQHRNPANGGGAFAARSALTARSLTQSPVAHLVTLLLAVAIASSPTQASSPDLPTIKDIHVGIEGFYKAGAWTPVRVQLLSGSQRFHGQLIVQATDPNGVPAQFIGPTFDLGPNQGTELATYIKIGQSSSDLRVEIRSADGRRRFRTVSSDDISPPLATEQQLILTLGSDIGAGTPRSQSRTTGRAVGHRVVATAGLPRHWLGYSGVDVVVVTTGLQKPLAGIDDQQWEALRRWVELGGTIIASAATRSEEMFGEGRPLDWVLPGEIDRVVRQRQTSGIEQFAEATGRLDQVDSGGVFFSVPMVTLRNPRGKVEATEGFGAQRSAAVIRATFGLGRVIFVAFDLDIPPFSEWPDRSRLTRRLVDFALDSSGEDEVLRTGLGPVAHVGYTDLIGQLRRALDQFTGVRQVRFSWIAGLIAVYIVIIGPLDFWLLRRWGRPEWTWLTFTVSVVAFTALAVALAYGWKGNEFRCNQVTLVDADASSGTVRGTTWAHVFSPATCRLQLITAPAVAFQWISPPQQVTSWQGLPGDGFSGLDRHDRTETFSQPYQVRLNLTSPAEADASLVQFPIAVWSSQSLLGQWWGHANWTGDPPQLHASNDATLSGTISNPFAVDLDEVYLLYDRWAYRLGTLPQNSTVPIDGAGDVDLQTLLTQRKVVKGRNVATLWDQQSGDVDRVMQMLMFYGAAKGRVYTRLQHRFQRTVDWSDRLALNQAVLWGRSHSPGANILMDGRLIPNRSDWTYYRLLVPVSGPGDN